MKKLLVLFLVFGIIGCATTTNAKPTDADVAAIRQIEVSTQYGSDVCKQIMPWFLNPGDR